MFVPLPRLALHPIQDLGNGAKVAFQGLPQERQDEQLGPGAPFPVSRAPFVEGPGDQVGYGQLFGLSARIAGHALWERF